ncbi:hypothetical protein [Salibacter halophilus]|uniref:T9SS type A sorting domain-containing protein n=1 Tax=Salibacter halophilus TaxID=1803916 RepID=A0A6N6M9N6_9FLAO|nr:hypothetical protein [Salibacter halophilus]KAB1065229.1 hypothetical protein F3059_04545 [Salibacter halophilus]
MKAQLTLYLSIVLSIFSTNSFAQLFNVDTTYTVLEKTVDQSPAHWYINITSNVSVDTTLRWKTSFSKIPNEWVIGFDDQTNTYSNLNDGDSADFILQANPPVIQKLVISNTMNGKTGNSSVFFDLYDPNVPSEVTTIEYEFKIRESELNSVSRIDETSPLFGLKNQALWFHSKLIGSDYRIVDLNGRTVYRNTISATSHLLPDLNSGIYIMNIPGKELQSKKIYIP